MNCRPDERCASTPPATAGGAGAGTSGTPDWTIRANSPELSSPELSEPAAVHDDIPFAGCDAGALIVTFSDVACREVKKPHFQVLLAIAEKPKQRSSKKSG